MTGSAELIDDQCVTAENTDSSWYHTCLCWQTV